MDRMAAIDHRFGGGGFYPAHCDEQCKECEKNQCGWCIWKDQATPYYNMESFTATQTNVYYESSNIQKGS